MPSQDRPILSAVLAFFTAPSASGRSRLSILTVFFISLIALQLTLEKPHLSTDLLFLSFIILAAFWFRLGGGILAAVISCFSLYPGLPGTPAVHQYPFSPEFLALHSIAYLAVGTAVGYLSVMLHGPGGAQQGKRLIARLKAVTGNVTASSRFKLSVVAAGFIALVCLRVLMESFAISLGYIYLLFISLAGYWFGVRGGVIAAFAAMAIFILELNVHRSWPGRDFVLNGMALRFLIYFLEGFLLGYLHDLDRMFREEKKSKEYFETLAYYDELTGCVNYRWAMQLFEKEIALALRHSTELSLVMIDIDHFKKINDEFGHLVGNDALRTFSGILRHNVRSVDVAGRYGGDEFMVLLHDASADQAVMLLERVRELLSARPLQSQYLKDREGPVLTFSAGVVSFPRNGTAMNELIDAADHALYQAKTAGRNRVFVEKRGCVRLKPKPGLRAELIDPSDGSSREASEVADISQRGVLLLFPNGNLPRGEFFCRISLEEQPLSELKCRVVREEENTDGRYSVGIYFADGSFADVREYSSDDGKK